MAKTRDLLRNKKIQEVFSIDDQASIVEATREMGRHDVGALIVQSRMQTVGIISERDIVRALREGGAYIDSIRVEDAMTKEVLIGVPEDDIDYVATIMTRFDRITAMD